MITIHKPSEKQCCLCKLRRSMHFLGALTFEWDRVSASEQEIKSVEMLFTAKSPEKPRDLGGSTRPFTASTWQSKTLEH